MKFVIVAYILLYFVMTHPSAVYGSIQENVKKPTRIIIHTAHKPLTFLENINEF